MQLFFLSAAFAQSILDVVAGSKDHTTLAKLATSLPAIVDVLKSAGPLTLFGPTDAAFDKLSKEKPDLFKAVTSDSALLAQVLQYHVIAGVAFDPTKAPARSFPKTALGSVVRADVGDKVTLAFGLGTSTVTASVTASNGVVHVVDSVLIPPTQKASEVAVAAGLTSLANALVGQKLVETVDGVKGATIFAPTNKAFDDLTAFAKANNLTLTDAILKSTLTLHVVPSVVYSTDIAAAKAPIAAKTANGANVQVSLSGKDVLVSGPGNKAAAKVVIADVLYNNGVIHVIDTVLLPDLSTPNVISSASQVGLIGAQVAPYLHGTKVLRCLKYSFQ
ncbi:FAS1 domain-containing protein [Gorgonomyces haynaldii]|nr:FAS1 domain-containing protein [Gorgonomyces haynaldii]